MSGDSMWEPSEEGARVLSSNGEEQGSHHSSRPLSHEAHLQRGYRLTHSLPDTRSFGPHDRAAHGESCPLHSSSWGVRVEQRAQTASSTCWLPPRLTPQALT